MINATGVWADRIRPEELHSEAEVPRIAPSRGTHITLRPEDLPLNAGAIVPAGGGRSIFALPWLGRSLIGTTDNNYDGDIGHVQPAKEDIDYLLDAVNAFFGTELTPGHLAGAYAGVRPLISTGDNRKSVDISRKAELYETSSGLITITGGKLTTWRRMAKLAVDRLVERDGRQAPCRTQEIPLGAPVATSELRQVEGVREDAYRQLAARYGFAAHRCWTAAEPRGTRTADRAGSSRSACRGRVLGPPRAGAHGRRCAAATDAAGPAGRPGAVRARGEVPLRVAPRWRRSSAGTLSRSRGRSAASASRRPPRDIVVDADSGAARALPRTSEPRLDSARPDC